MRWRLYSGIGAIFVLGSVAGGMIGINAERERLRKFEREGPALLMDGLAKRLEDELKLDPVQSRRVKEIYAATRPQLLQMERERRHRLRQMLDATQPQILEILTPPQQERYQQLQQKLQLRLRLREPGKAHEPPPTMLPPAAPPT
jgi:hypothetical protein